MTIKLQCILKDGAYLKLDTRYEYYNLNMLIICAISKGAD